MVDSLDFVAKGKRGNGIGKIKPIDLGFKIDLPKVNTVPPSTPNINTGMRQIKAGGSFDTTSSFKGLLATSKGGSQEIKISKEDIEKLRAGFKRFTSGGESLGKRLRSGKKSKTIVREVELDKATGRILPKGTLARPTISERAMEREKVSNLSRSERVLKNIRKQFGLK